MLKPQPDFVCAICQRNIDMRWKFGSRRRANETLPPLCGSCEHLYSQGVGKPSGGTFLDRRMAAQVLALATALHDEAARQQWGHRYV